MTGDRAAKPLQSHIPTAKGREFGAIGLLQEPTRRRLYELVAARAGIGRDEAADALGISRELAAFHLDKLVRGGLLETHYRRLSGRSGPGAGRPAKLYTRASDEVSVSLPARRYDVVAETFAEGLEALTDEFGADAVMNAVDEPARQRGREAGDQVRRAAGPRAGADRRAEELVKLLASSGFEPVVAADGTTVTLGNCPYRLVAEQHRELTCGMNLAWAQGLLEKSGETRLQPRLDTQPGRCCVVFTRE
jgi:predicted ArsR family transcriptional regulator